MILQKEPTVNLFILMTAIAPLVETPRMQCILELRFERTVKLNLNGEIHLLFYSGKCFSSSSPFASIIGQFEFLSWLQRLYNLFSRKSQEMRIDIVLKTSIQKTPTNTCLAQRWTFIKPVIVALFCRRINNMQIVLLTTLSACEYPWFSLMLWPQSAWVSLIHVCLCLRDHVTTGLYSHAFWGQ